MRVGLAAGRAPRGRFRLPASSAENLAAICTSSMGAHLLQLSRTSLRERKVVDGRVKPGHDDKNAKFPAPTEAGQPWGREAR